MFFNCCVVQWFSVELVEFSSHVLRGVQKKYLPDYIYSKIMPSGAKLLSILKHKLFFK